jgi:hypothetical protein
VIDVAQRGSAISRRHRSRRWARIRCVIADLGNAPTFSDTRVEIEAV